MAKTQKNIEHMLIKAAIATTMALPLALGGCHKPDPEEPVSENHAPQVYLEVNPTSGHAPLEVRMKLTGTDIDGIDDIKEYRLNVNGKVIKRYEPIDTTMKFRNPGNIQIYGEVMDYGNAIGKSNSNSIKVDPRIENPFVQPNDSTLAWYGSGDVDGNNYLDWNDYNAMSSTSNDQADIDGDGIPSTANDKKLLEDKLNGTLTHLPGYWNELNKEEKIDWVSKAYAIDQTSGRYWRGDYNCFHFTYQTNINMRGYNQEDISTLSQFYPFDFSNNGRFNIPIYELQLASYDSEGIPTNGHDMCAIFVGDNLDSNTSLMRKEPQNDGTNPPLGEGYLTSYGNNTKMFVYGAPLRGGNEGLNATKYITYKVESGNVTLEEINTDIITEKEK